MNNSYLIPANSKRSLLVASAFNTVDLWIFGIGIGLSFLMLMVLPIENFWVAVLAISPGLIGGFLVIPVPNYHNIRTVIKNAWIFYTTRQKYVWKGWCFESGEETNKK